MKQLTRFLMLVLGTALLCTGLILPISATEDTPTDPYTQMLIDKGFPRSYAQKLTELHYLHPAWEFEPLPVTELEPTYTWEYVIGKETENPKTNLINKSDRYAAYRHATNTELYDSGWFQASPEAVSYFMDPENFLNEKDIFMFRDLTYTDAVTEQSVEAALSGTFMSHAVLQDDVTYAAYLVEIGKQLNVDPLHLAARLRQEQGTAGNSPLIKGTCGDKLWYYYENAIQAENDKQILAPATGYTKEELLAYNGYYNYFNIGAAGTGYFAIYLGAMKEATKGTAEMAEAWGGNAAWDTPAKAIYGGAYKLTHKYVGDYQNTLYLQKFNVDPRSSRNFWGQYMQNVGATVTEARTAFNSLYASDCLELPYHFLIPVFAGKPERNPDPAGGACDTYAAADTLVHTEATLTSPVTAGPSMDGVLYVQDLHVIRGESLRVALSAHATLVYDTLLLRINGTLTEAQTAHDGTVTPSLLPNHAADPYPNSLTFDCAALPEGDYTLAVYGRLGNPGKSCPHHLLAVIKLHVDPVPETTTEEITTEEPTTEEPTTEQPTTEQPTTETVTTTPPKDTEKEPTPPTGEQTAGPSTGETPTYGPGAAQGQNSCKSLVSLSLPLGLMAAWLVCKKKK